MPVYPVYDLFRTIGSVNVTLESLYLSYEARVSSQRTGFLRLYCHGGEKSTRLSLFCREDGDYFCRGRVSLRSLGALDERVLFSVQGEPFFPGIEPLDRGYCPKNVLCFIKEGRRFAVLDRQNDLPEEILPYFCFLVPVRIDSADCLVLQVDSRGKPVVAKNFPEIFADG